jgi:Domain of unknown function (DUF4349)
MNSSRDHSDLNSELRALRPTPRPAFAAELDEKVAAGFPRRSLLGESPLAALEQHLRALSPRRLLLSSGATALAAVALATVVVVSTESGPEVKTSTPSAGLERPAPTTTPDPEAKSRPAPEGPFSFGSVGGAEAGAASAGRSSAGVAHAASGPVAANSPHRDVERSAEVVLGADPADVAEDASRVFDAVHAADGIVLRSSTVEGPAGRAGAEFDLLIPSANLGDALADFSAIDEVRSRHEATVDITAPTVAVGDRLQDSRARIDGLLAQLAAAETESEREAVEAELHAERRHLAFLRARLAKLDRRANFSRVSLRIETGAASAPSDEGGTWGIGDALHDAGHLLTIAAAVALVSLAVLGPIALIAVLAWLTQRAWVRRGRERALG